MKSFFSNVDGPRDCHTEWSKSNRERQMLWYHLYKQSKNLFTNRNISTDIEIKLRITMGEGGERNKLGDWDRHIPKKIKAVNTKRNQS